MCYRTVRINLLQLRFFPPPRCCARCAANATCAFALHRPSDGSSLGRLCRGLENPGSGWKIPAISHGIGAGAHHCDFYPSSTEDVVGSFSAASAFAPAR